MYISTFSQIFSLRGKKGSSSAPDTRAGGKKNGSKIMDLCCRIRFYHLVVFLLISLSSIPLKRLPVIKTNESLWLLTIAAACAINNNVAKKFAIRKWVISPRQRRLPFHFVRKANISDFAVDLRENTSIDFSPTDESLLINEIGENFGVWWAVQLSLKCYPEK